MTRRTIDVRSGATPRKLQNCCISLVRRNVGKGNFCCINVFQLSLCLHVVLLSRHACQSLSMAVSEGFCFKAEKPVLPAFCCRSWGAWMRTQSLLISSTASRRAQHLPQTKFQHGVGTALRRYSPQASPSLLAWQCCIVPWHKAELNAGQSKPCACEQLISDDRMHDSSCSQAH